MRRRTGRSKKRQHTPRHKADAKNMARTWSALLESCASVFPCPALPLFVQLASAWVLCPARHTVTRMLETIAPAQGRPHDAYHRFVRAGAWRLAALWAVLAKGLIATLAAPGVLPLVLDDTRLHKSGRRVNGAGSFRDAVRSTSARGVYAGGLKLVVLGLRVTPPWGGENRSPCRSTCACTARAAAP